MTLGVLGPHHLSRPGPRRRDRTQEPVVEAVEQPPTGRVRGDRTEHGGLISQHRDVGDRRRAIGQRDGHVDQDPARVVAGPRSPQPGQRVRQAAGQGGPIGDIGQQPRPNMRHHPVPIGGDDDLRTRGCSLHLESASLTGRTEPSVSPVLPGRGALSAFRVPIGIQDHEEPGLGHRP